MHRAIEIEYSRYQPLLTRSLSDGEQPRRPTLRPPPPNLLRPWLANRASSTAPAPERPLVERRAAPADLLRDIIIGFSDGLTVPFALTAALSSLGDTRLVVMGGLAELCSGMVSMGLGAYLAADTERQHWNAELDRARDRVRDTPAMERAKVIDLLLDYCVRRASVEPLADDLAAAANRAAWARFMMDFDLRLPEPDPGRAWMSAAAMGLSYFVGGLVPMLPYFVLAEVRDALAASVGISVVVLLVFGFLKNWAAIRTRRAALWGAVQTLAVGALAAGTSYAIVKLLDAGGD